MSYMSDRYFLKCENYVKTWLSVGQARPTFDSLWLAVYSSCCLQLSCFCLFYLWHFSSGESVSGVAASELRACRLQEATACQVWAKLAADTANSPLSQLFFSQLSVQQMHRVMGFHGNIVHFTIAVIWCYFTGSWARVSIFVFSICFWQWKETKPMWFSNFNTAAEFRWI